MAPVVTAASVRLPSGLTSTALAGRQVTLSNPVDPLSVVTLRDSAVVNGRKSLTVYAAATRTFTTTSPAGRTATTRVDVLGRPIELTAPGITPVTFAYDARGNVTSTKQGARGTTYAYDAAGRVTQATDALGRSAAFAYDAAGRLTRQTLPGGRVIAYGYDAAGNLTSLTPPGTAGGV
jgi:YD repeat-containing protein